MTTRQASGFSSFPRSSVRPASPDGQLHGPPVCADVPQQGTTRSAVSPGLPWGVLVFRGNASLAPCLCREARVSPLGTRGGPPRVILPTRWQRSTGSRRRLGG